MAKRLNVKLSSCKHTKRSTSGGVTHHLVPMVCISKTRECTSKQSEKSVLEPKENTSGLLHGDSVQQFRHDMAADNLATLHYVFQKQSIESGRKVRLLKQNHYLKTNCVLFTILKWIHIVTYSAILDYIIVQPVLKMHTVEQIIYSIRQKFGK